MRGFCQAHAWAGIDFLEAGASRSCFLFVFGVFVCCVCVCVLLLEVWDFCCGPSVFPCLCILVVGGCGCLWWAFGFLRVFAAGGGGELGFGSFGVL